MFDVNCAICKKLITEESEELSSNGGIICTAIMINQNSFIYGLDGVFEFTDDIAKLGFTFKKDDEVCTDCINKYEDFFKPKKSVQCSICKKLYQACWGTIDDKPCDSGWGCSATVENIKEQLKLSCGWGSRYDCDLYTITKGLELKQNVCDDCIDSFLKDGTLVSVEEVDFFPK